MKNIKFILILFLFVSITGCSDNASAPPFSLSATNMAGNYDIGAINAEEEETATSNSGTVVNVSTTTFVGDSFDDINFALNTNGTYTASGKYRIVITETPNGGAPVNDFEIVVFDATGSYQINNIDNTITFNPSTGDFLEGLFTVVTFTETSITMTQEETDIDGGITTTLEASISLVRK
jgi:hypothetical protein